MKKANKQMMELRTGEAASMLAQGHSCTVLTTPSERRVSIIRRQSGRFTDRVMDLSRINQVAMLPVQGKLFH